ncbi:DCL family protein [Bradyrhizobium sp. F1.13.3]|uniref:DCL family protein n=1 Tax=Bradyrhizobium sp. F1.13.3 TaxID=3156351 RepID=UPI00339B864C
MSFARKGDPAEHFRQILYRRETGVALAEPDATHVYWLLERPPEAAAKIGVGVKEFGTRKSMYNTRCFEIRRIDGSTTDFSVKPCLDDKAPSAFAETLRTEVVEDIKQMKWEFFRASTHFDGKPEP